MSHLIVELLLRLLKVALAGLVARWRAGTLDSVQLSPEWKERLSRRTNVRDLAALLGRVSAAGGRR